MNFTTLPSASSITSTRKTLGFTILEILVVISVIAILIGIAIPKFKGMQDHAKTIKATGDLRTIQAALESYYIHNHNTYPVTTDNICADSLISQSPQLINAPLYDPFAAANTEYKYMVSSPNGTHFVVWSVGLPGQTPPSSVTDAGEILY